MDSCLETEQVFVVAISCTTCTLQLPNTAAGVCCFPRSCDA
jgi:hypothetical protein